MTDDTEDLTEGASAEAGPDTVDATEEGAAPTGAQDEAPDWEGATPDADEDEDGRAAKESADHEEPLETEVAQLREELEALNDRHLRLAAEFNNYRRRSEQARLETWSRAQADLVARFIDVLDDLHRVAGLDLSNATVEAIMEGVDLVERKFVRMIEDAGLEMIDPMGEPFDPERMEAMMRVPTETEAEDDHVAQVFAKGYTLDGILVRPARVSVHKLG